MDARSAGGGAHSPIGGRIHLKYRALIHDIRAMGEAAKRKFADGEVFNAMRLFTGQEFDYELGLYNYKARLFDQWTGRFLQTDPVHSDRDGYDVYDRYLYTSGDPINHTDPSGKSWLKDNLTLKNVSNLLLGDHAFTLGITFTAINYVGGWINKWMYGGDAPKIYRRNGAFITEGSVMPKGSGISLGPFINVSKNPSESTIRHELAHVNQYRKHGGIGYLNLTMKSPFHNLSNSGGVIWAESDADKHAGTNAYGNNPYYQFVALQQTLKQLRNGGMSLIFARGLYELNMEMLTLKMDILYEADKNETLYIYQLFNPDFNAISWLND